jgi:uncharacterized protein
MKSIEKSSLYDAKLGTLSHGCTECLQGNKTVLFVTGVCPRHCYYCPLSEEKWLKDASYANEWKIQDINNIIEEIKLCDSTGIGITGGDPLAKFDRTIEFIQKLKQEFGKQFHMHLYTSLDLVTLDKLKMLFSAGLDEIRVHPDLENKMLWEKISLLKQFLWDTTVEIPVIPHLKQQTKELMQFCNNKIDFMNLNELELSYTNNDELLKRDYHVKESLSHGAKGSQETAMELLEYAKQFSYNVHYCSSHSKDVQMQKRIKKRAKNAKFSTDLETDEGTLIRGIIYLKGLEPGFNYQKKIALLSQIEKENALKTLKEAKKEFSTLLRVPSANLHIDPIKLRLITSINIVEKHADSIKKKGFLPAFVEEYPTQDSLEVQVQFF